MQILQGWLAKAKKIRGPAPLSEGPRSEQLEKLLVVVPYKAPAKKVKKKEVREDREGLRRRVRPGHRSGDAAASSVQDGGEDEDEEEEWVEVDPSELESTSNMQVDEDSKSDDEMADLEMLDPSDCFMCDLKHDNIEDCMIHMHKKHGFFIPDSEYMKDPNGILIYVGLKVGIFPPVLMVHVR